MRNCSVITTPIFYVNARPHLGHAYSMLIADAFARWKRKDSNSSVILSTGTDEHGQKIWQAAQANHKPVLEWCDGISNEFRNLAKILNISHSDFIRTTEPRHYKTVHEIWNTLLSKGDIYKGTHEGWYSVSDETFYSEAETKEISAVSRRVAIESGKPVEWISEENYRFKLSKYVPIVRKWLESGPIYPANRGNDLMPFLDSIEKNGQDLSVSRRKSTAKWGIPVPGDENDQIIYVWLDALSNYLTVQSETTRKTSQMTHIVGKDILKFHAIYWPAILSAAGYPLPQRIVAHGHWTMDSEKMSKSLGNVVDPGELIHNTFSFSSPSADPLRYFLLRTGKLNSDCPFTQRGLVDCYNNELAGNLGNLISRVFKKYSVSDFDKLKDCKINDPELKSKLIGFKDRCDSFYDRFQFPQVADLGMDLLNAANRYISRVEPWKIKDPIDHLNVAGNISELLKVFSRSIEPIIPETSLRIIQILHGTDNIPTSGIFPRIK